MGNIDFALITRNADEFSGCCLAPRRPHSVLKVRRDRHTRIVDQQPAAPSAPPVRGVVKFWKTAKGWGAISSDVLPSGRDAFAHFSAIEAAGFRSLDQGQLVDFTYRAEPYESFDLVADWVRPTTCDSVVGEAGYSTRPATATDGEWLRTLHTAAYAVLSGQLYDEHADAWQRGFFSARIAHPEDVFIITKERTDVGAVYLAHRPDSVFVESLEVLPEHQNRGAGSAALRWVLGQAAQQGRTVTLQVHKVNTGARTLYERLGFSVIGETETHYKLLSVKA